MRSSLKTVVVAASLLLATHFGSVFAQTDAETALQNARTAFANERFEAARDLLETASQTDAENPDIILLLGRAHYQLGELDQAIAAWRRTLKLAPAHAYAKRMVDTLQGKILDADVRIKVIESLLEEQLPQLAQPEIFSLKRGSLSRPQLVRLLSLEAQAMIDLGQAGEALKSLRELAVRDPDQSATAHTRLLTGKAKLALGGDSIAEGLAILTAVKAEFADAVEGVAADLALISFRMDQGEDAIDELAAWITANPQHVDRHAARQTMIRAVSVFLQEAARQPIPNKEDALSEVDSRVLAAAEHALTSLKQADDSLQLANQLVAHIQTRLIANGSFAAADTALQRLLNLELPNPSRTAFETTLNNTKSLAASEELGLILVAIKDGDGSPEALANWIQRHAQHTSLSAARRSLVAAYLEQTLRQGNPSADAELTQSDKAAIVVAGQVLQSLDPVREKLKLIQELLAHLKSHYSTHGANAAAISGQRAILDLQLPRVVRRAVLSELADTQTTVALARLESEVSAGTLEAGPLPADLLAVLQTFAAISQEFPDQPSWSKQASVGARIVALSPRIEWPAKVTQIKATDGWALEFVLPVIVADPDLKTMKTASSVVSAVVDGVAAIGQKSARGLAATAHQRLLDVLPEDHTLWPQTVIRQLSLRIVDDASRFRENVGAGQGQLNAKLTEDQKSILALASTLIGRRPRMAPQVLSELQPFLALRKKAGYDALVQLSYALLEESLPPPQLRSVRLAVAQSWVDQVIGKHTRLLANGFQPPKELDPQLQKTLVRCYELASDLEPGHEFVKVVQGVRSTVIAHYRNLQYQETAAVAIKVKAEQSVEWLDAAAEFELASLRMSIALDVLANQTRRFQGRENMTLTPAVQQALAGFEQFVTDRPTDRLVSQAVTKILSVGKTYENYEKYDTAAQIYANLETFATNNQALQQAKPNTATVAQRTALAVAVAMHVKARRSLAETMKGQPDDADPPAELSEEFQQAVAAYQAIITKYSDSPLISSAIGKLMEIALQHASVGAWDVAESVYADLQAQQLPLRQPERLDFARALCEMGKVIPQHARQMLAAITLWERQTRSADGAVSQLAMGFDQATGVMGDPFGGGFGGAGMEGQSEEMMMEMMEMGGAIANAPATAETPPLDDLFGAPATVPEVADQIVGDFAVDSARAVRESDLLAAVRRQQSALASQVAMLRDNEIQHVERNGRAAIQQGQQAAPQLQRMAVPVLSDAEIARRQTILDVAYTKLQAIRKLYADSTTAGQAREQILVIVNHWRSIKHWQRSAELVKRFLADNPTDSELPNLRHEIARDYLAWAAGAVKPGTPKQEMLDEVNKRFTLAREELSGIIAAFPDQQSLKHQAQWDIATSHLSQARVVAGFSSTLARGQFVRAANELLATADQYHDHPQIGELPQMLWNIAQELTNRRFYDEAITVWNEMTLHYPGDPLAEQAALQIAQTYQHQLRLPLRAVESYLELNFARGGSDTALQDSIFQIATRTDERKALGRVAACAGDVCRQFSHPCQCRTDIDDDRPGSPNQRSLGRRNRRLSTCDP